MDQIGTEDWLTILETSQHRRLLAHYLRLPDDHPEVQRHALRSEIATLSVADLTWLLALIRDHGGWLFEEFEQWGDVHRRLGNEAPTAQDLLADLAKQWSSARAGAREQLEADGYASVYRDLCAHFEVTWSVVPPSPRERQ